LINNAIQDKLKDTEEVTRSRKSKKDRQHNDQKKKTDPEHNDQKKKTDNTMTKRKRQTTQ
jgi:hypothetical protein